jgi:hypothetical protein
VTHEPNEPNPLTDRRLAELWRRQFECMDTLLHGYLSAELARREGRDPGPAAVTFTDLSSARHSLSVPRFYAQDQLDAQHFQDSDPAYEFYPGKLEADFQRIRNEQDAAFE